MWQTISRGMREKGEGKGEGSEELEIWEGREVSMLLYTALNVAYDGGVGLHRRGKGTSTEG